MNIRWDIAVSPVVEVVKQVGLEPGNRAIPTVVVCVKLLRLQLFIHSCKATDKAFFREEVVR
jgi:hypothetical protein